VQSENAEGRVAAHLKFSSVPSRFSAWKKAALVFRGGFFWFIAEWSDQPASELVALSRPGNRWTPDARRRTLAFKTWTPWPPGSLRKMHYPI